MDKFQIQAGQYKFPYHYLPNFVDGVPRSHRSLSWGLGYMTYMTYVMGLIRKLNPKNILDVGCGDGFLLNHLKLDGKKVGIDLESKAINFAKCFSTDALFEEKNIKDVHEKFFMVSFIEVIEHINDDDLDLFLKVVYDKIANGGYLLISVPTTVIPVSKKHYRHYDETLLMKTLEKFDLKELESVRLYNNRSIAQKIIKKILHNKFFIVNYQPAIKFLWNLHEKFSYYADKKTGLHLCVLLQKPM